MWYCRKTNRYFDSFRGFLNHILKEYGSVERGYVEENDIVPPKCKYCDSTCSFISYKKGYNNICGSKPCIKKKVTDNNRIIAQKRKESEKFKKEEWELKNSPLYKKICYEDWKYFIYKNIHFYRKNINKNNIIEPFSQFQLKTQTLKDFINAKTIGKDAFVIKSYCENCGGIYNRYVLDPKYDQYCKKCYSNIRRKFTKDKLNSYIYIKNNKKISTKSLNNIFVMAIYKNYNIDILIKKYNITKKDVLNNTILKRFDKINFLGVWKCPETGWIIPVTKNTKEYLEPFLEAIEINFLDYIKDYFPKLIAYCENCGNVVEIGKYLFGEVKRKNRFCNHACYNQFRKENDVGNFTEESRKRQSEVMKKKIKNGEFFPCVNNHWNGDIILHDNIKFRSSWEVLFYEIMKYNGKNVKYENLILPYYDSLKEKNRNYIVDFIDEENKIIYEVKPRSQVKDTNSLDKEKTAIKWCTKNGFKFKYIDENYLQKNTNNDIINFISEYVLIKLRGFLNEN